MNLKAYFNIFLLSLTLTTVVVTLVIYIVHKFRQISKKQDTKEKHFLTGVYFERYAPLLEEENKVFLNTRPTPKRMSTNKKTLLLIILVFILISIFFFFEHYYRGIW